MKLYKTVYYINAKDVDEDVYCHKDNAVRGALSYIKRKLGIKPSEIEVEEEDIGEDRGWITYIYFYEMRSMEKIHLIHIETFDTLDEY